MTAIDRKELVTIGINVRSTGVSRKIQFLPDTGAEIDAYPWMTI